MVTHQRSDVDRTVALRLVGTILHATAGHWSALCALTAAIPGFSPIA
jgi:hypothetical protein